VPRGGFNQNGRGGEENSANGTREETYVTRKNVAHHLWPNVSKKRGTENNEWSAAGGKKKTGDFVKKKKKKDKRKG